MTHAVHCPACQNRVGVPDDMIGRNVRCPKCAEEFEATVNSPPPAESRIQSPPPLPASTNRSVVVRDEQRDRIPRRRRFDSYDDFDVPHPRFRQGPGIAGRAVCSICGLSLCIIAYLACIAADLYCASFLNRMPHGFAAFAAMDEAHRVDEIRLVAFLGRLAAIVFTAICISFWVHRAADNLRLFRCRGVRNAPSAAVGAFFIPVLNFIRPIQVMQEIWKAGDPRSSPTTWQNSPISALIPTWWIVTLIGTVVIFTALQMLMLAQQRLDPVTIVEATRNAAYLSAIGGMISVVGAALGMLVVRSVTKRQEVKCLQTQSGDICEEEDEY